jgi:hypothetical protein
MAYADLEYYRNVYLGHPEKDDATLLRYLQRASDDIDANTIVSIDVASLNDDAVEWLKKATCARAEMYVFNGDDPDSNLDGSLGSFSIRSGGTSSGSNLLNKRCSMFLVHAGLMYRGI